MDDKLIEFINTYDIQFRTKTNVSKRENFIWLEASIDGTLIATEPINLIDIWDARLESGEDKHFAENSSILRSIIISGELYALMEYIELHREAIKNTDFMVLDVNDDGNIGAQVKLKDRDDVVNFVISGEPLDNILGRVLAYRMEKNYPNGNYSVATPDGIYFVHRLVAYSLSEED